MYIKSKVVIYNIFYLKACLYQPDWFQAVVHQHLGIPAKRVFLVSFKCYGNKPSGPYDEPAFKENIATFMSGLIFNIDSSALQFAVSES